MAAYTITYKCGICGGLVVGESDKSLKAARMDAGTKTIVHGENNHKNESINWTTLSETGPESQN